MIYTINEARNVDEYRAEKAAREKAEQDKKDKQYNSRYNNKGLHKVTDGEGNETKYGFNGYPVGARNRADYGNTFSLSAKKFRASRKGPDADDVTRTIRAASATGATKDHKDWNQTKDAVNRNMRRHPERWDGDKPVKPKSESTIFDDIEIV